jgi:hypothetical protein
MDKPPTTEHQPEHTLPPEVLGAVALQNPTTWAEYAAAKTIKSGSQTIKVDQTGKIVNYPFWLV